MRRRLTYLKYLVFPNLDVETEYALAKSEGKEDTLYPVLNPGRVQSIHMDEKWDIAYAFFLFQSVFPFRYYSCLPKPL